MKRVHLIGIGFIIVAIVLLISASDDMSTYSTFGDAHATAKKVKIVGQLSKDKDIYFNPERDPNYFSFYIRDRVGEERKVILKQAKPQDFELSEQIVVTGKMQGEEFVASEILLKCPSKYKDEEIFIKEEAEI